MPVCLVVHIVSFTNRYAERLGAIHRPRSYAARKRLSRLMISEANLIYAWLPLQVLS